jgi:SAM-dependent methyltransferase
VTQSTEDPGRSAAPTFGDLPTRLQERAEHLKREDPRRHMGGRINQYELIGRHQLEVLLREGLYPSSKLLDLGCGSLRGGYWAMHFLDPGCYYGIDPFPEWVQVGLDFIVEPETVERAAPTFSHNDDFDLSVFGVKFDFVIARSIWTHMSKAQIRTMLDSFLKASALNGVMLVSYVPASSLPEPVRARLVRLLQKIPRGLALWRRAFGRAPDVADYDGTEWEAGLVGHTFRWISAECATRGLAVRELDYGVLGHQVWLRIERASRPAADRDRASTPATSPEE